MSNNNDMDVGGGASSHPPSLFNNNNNNISSSMDLLHVGAGADSVAPAPASASLDFPIDLLSQFSMKNVHTNGVGQQVPLPLEVSRWLAMNNHKDKKNKELGEIREQIKQLSPAVMTFLDNMDGKEIQLQNLSSHESSLFGPRGKLKCVERPEKVGPCTQSLLFQRLAMFAQQTFPKCTEEDGKQFAKGAVEYVWAGIEEKFVRKLERTIPKKKKVGAAASARKNPTLPPQLVPSSSSSSDMQQDE